MYDKSYHQLATSDEQPLVNIQVIYISGRVTNKLDPHSHRDAAGSSNLT